MTRLETRLVHPPTIPGEPARATSTPLYQTATFAQDLDDPSATPWDYSRSGNPTRDVLEQQLATLDGATDALAYGSGIAAVSAVLRLARPGDEIVCGDDLYGGTQRLLDAYARQLGISVAAVDTTDVEAVARAVTHRTRLVFVETPTNPRLRTCDVQAIARTVHARGALLAVDHSMLSPLLLRPLELGADLAVQSATKLLGGHGDLTAGVVATRDPGLSEQLRWMQNAEGTALAPFPAWLLLRGLETLDVRLQRQLDNVGRLLLALQDHPAIRRLRYPDAGVVISFETGSLEASRAVISRTRFYRTTVSFGGVTSSISLPCSMSHAAVPEERRREQGLLEDLIRVSVGVEAADDLVDDLIGALDTIATPAVTAADRLT